MSERDQKTERRDGEDRRQGKPELSDGYTRIANELLEACYRDPDRPVWVRIMDYLTRVTYGFQRSEAKVSQRELAEAIGASRETTNRNLKRLIKAKRVLIANPKTDGVTPCVTGRKAMYRINKYYDAWKPMGSYRKKWTPRASQVVDPPCVTRLDPPCVTGHNNKENFKERVKEREKPKSAWRPPTGSELKLKEPWLNVIAWDEWIQYRSAIKKPYKTQVGVTKALNVLRKYDAEVQQAIIDKSIAAEYQGLFPPKKGGNGNGKAREPTAWERSRDSALNQARFLKAMRKREKEIRDGKQPNLLNDSERTGQAEHPGEPTDRG